MQESILRRFEALRLGKSGDKRAPHKPLLALWAIGRCLRGESRLTTYELVDRELTSLLRRFAPRRKTIHTEDPFWRMQKDDVWEVNHSGSVRLTSSGGAWKQDLKNNMLTGGLREEDYKLFRSDPKIAYQVAQHLVLWHFPATLHDEVLEATLNGENQTSETSLEHIEKSGMIRPRRDPKFRKQVLEAYDSKCAICEFVVRRGNDPLALEAAHIKWHVANGPNMIENGLSLCVLHHNLFDRGAFTLLTDLTVIVADNITGEGVKQSLGKYHGSPLRAMPGDGFPLPAAKFLAWHQSEVFMEPYLL